MIRKKLCDYCLKEKRPECSPEAQMEFLMSESCDEFITNPEDVIEFYQSTTPLFTYAQIMAAHRELNYKSKIVTYQSLLDKVKENLGGNL